MPSAIRHFVIAFLIATLIFGILGAILLGWFGKAVRENEKSHVTDNTDADLDSDSEEGDTGNNQHTALRGQSFSMLLILNDYQPDRYEYGIPDNYSGIVTPRYKQAQAIVYLRFSRETATLYTSVIPVQTLVTVEGVSMTLAEAYHHTGAQYLCDRVASMLGVGINYYVDATYDQFVSLVDGSAMNGVNLNVPQDLQITLRSGTPLSLKAGTQFMDGERLLALLTAGQQKRSAWLGGVQNELAHILLEELTTLEHKRNPEGFFVSVLSGFSTNLKAELVAANAEMMFAYFDLKQEELTLPGQYNGEGEFVPDISKMAEIYRIGTALE